MNNMPARLRHSMAVLLSVLGSSAASGATIYVPADYPEIQTAIEEASDGDSVLVAAGTYEERISFLGKAVAVLGEDAATTTVDAGLSKTQEDRPVIDFSSGEGRDSRLEGLTVTGGSSAWAGGIRIDGASPTVTRCRISGNEANSAGVGGILCTDGASPLISFCRIDNNIATSPDGAGGVKCDGGARPVFNECSIAGNRGRRGRNQARAGGVLVEGESRPEFYSCSIARNFDGLAGGVHSNWSYPRFVDCVFEDNRGTVGGLYIYTSSIAAGGVQRERGSVATSDEAGIAGKRGPGRMNEIRTTEVMTESALRPEAYSNAGFRNFNGGGGGGTSSRLSPRFVPNGSADGRGRVRGTASEDSVPSIESCRFEGNEGDLTGGGLYVSKSDAVVRLHDSVFIDNCAGRGGGGAAFAFAEAVIERCEFTGNCAAEDGGGLEIYWGNDVSLFECDIRDNEANDGGGLTLSSSRPLIEACNIEGNVARTSGGGICGDDGGPIAFGTNIVHNSALFGGGVCLTDSWGTTPSVTLSTCVIADNFAEINGGGIRGDSKSFRVENSLLSRNESLERGGAMWISGSETVVVANCTLAENRSEAGGSIYSSMWPSAKFTNSIFWSDSPTEVAGDGASLSYCNVKGGYEGTGNIASPPRFRTFGDYEFVLGPGSPCIDAGEGLDGIDWSTIRPGYGRVNGSTADMGAYGGEGAVDWLE